MARVSGFPQSDAVLSVDGPPDEVRVVGDRVSKCEMGTVVVEAIHDGIPTVSIGSVVSGLGSAEVASIDEAVARITASIK
jgi:hypothetical protein